jgi:taurine dioxygenase
MVQIEKLTGLMGAEITGFDITNGVTADMADFLRQALADYQMIALRDLHPTIKQQKELTEVFGPIMKLPYVEPMAEDDEVIAVLKEADECNKGVFGGDWHSDFSFLENPPAGSILSAIEVPQVGGDTVWASQVSAYTSLPETLKSVVDGRKAVHIGAPYGVTHQPPEEEQAGASVRMSRGDPAADREILHPAVIREPLSGRQALFLNPIYTTRFEDMTEEESAPILANIYKHCTRPDFSCRFRWRAGDVAIWDNRTCLHYATNDYDGTRRLLYRTTFSADPPAA